MHNLPVVDINSISQLFVFQEAFWCQIESHRTGDIQSEQPSCYCHYQMAQTLNAPELVFASKHLKFSKTMADTIQNF